MPESLPPNPSDSVRSGPLAQIPLFAHLDTEQQATLFKTMHLRFVEVNQTIFWMGDPGDSFYLVSKGRVAVTVPSPTGEHVTLDTVGPGGFFGEISLLDGEPRTATLRAVEPSELYVLSRAHFHEFLVRHPSAAINILTIMGQRQRASTLALRGIKNANQAFDETLTPGSWHFMADTIARVAASRDFLMIHVLWFGVWIIANMALSTGWFGIKAWDPFPFGLLTMIVSLEAIFLSIFVMVSQNRQAERDRLRTDLDYQVNVKAQTEIMEISRRLERLEKAIDKR